MWCLTTLVDCMTRHAGLHAVADAEASRQRTFFLASPATADRSLTTVLARFTDFFTTLHTASTPSSAGRGPDGAAKSAAVGEIITCLPMPQNRSERC